MGADAAGSGAKVGAVLLLLALGAVAAFMLPALWPGGGNGVGSGRMAAGWTGGSRGGAEDREERRREKERGRWTKGEYQ